MVWGLECARGLLKWFFGFEGVKGLGLLVGGPGGSPRLRDRDLRVGYIGGHRRAPKFLVPKRSALVTTRRF